LYGSCSTNQRALFPYFESLISSQGRVTVKRPRAPLYSVPVPLPCGPFPIASQDFSRNEYQLDYRKKVFAVISILAKQWQLLYSTKVSFSWRSEAFSRILSGKESIDWKETLIRFGVSCLGPLSLRSSQRHKVQHNEKSSLKKRCKAYVGISWTDGESANCDGFLNHRSKAQLGRTSLTLSWNRYCVINWIVPSATFGFPLKGSAERPDLEPDWCLCPDGSLAVVRDQKIQHFSRELANLSRWPLLSSFTWLLDTLACWLRTNEWNLWPARAGCVALRLAQVDRIT